MKKIRLLIADDHSLMRLGLKAMIAYQKDMEVVGEATNGQQAVQKAAELKPDVVIMDLMMPVLGGAEATRLIREANPAARIVILTSYGSSADLARAIAHGACGAQSKEAPMEGLLDAIRTVVSGGTAIAPELQQTLDAEPAPPDLTERQTDILAAVVQGLSNKDIGDAFGISPVSVKKHLSVIFTKIGAANRAEAVAIALRKHLLKI